MAPQSTDTPHPRRASAPASRILRRIVLTLLILSGLAGALAWLALDNETSLRWALERAIQAAGPDRLIIEGLSGTLARGLQAKRIQWRDAPDDPSLTIEILDVAADLSLRGLLRRKLVLSALSARLVTVDIVPNDQPPTLPHSLALPIELAVDDAQVARLEIRRGGQRDVFSDLRFTYEGGANAHRIDKLSAVLRDAAGHADIDAGIALRGNITAAAPFTLKATVTAKLANWAASKAAETLDASLEIKGTLAALQLAGTAEASGATAKAGASLSPFSSRWLERLDLQASKLDLARLGRAFDRTFPDALLDLRLGDVQLVPGSGKDTILTGNVRLINARAGAAADGRVPVRSLRAALRFDSRGTLLLGGLQADIAPAGEVRGDVRIIGRAVQASLALTGVSARAIAAQLHDMRLSGRITASGKGEAQEANVDLTGTDGPNAPHTGVIAALMEPAHRLRLSARLARTGEQLRIEQGRLSAGNGEAIINADIRLSGESPFSAQARISRIDPAAFGDFPQGSLNAGIDFNGRLADRTTAGWLVDARARIDNSRLWGLPLAGRAQARLDARSAQHIDTALTLGTSRISATGGIAWSDRAGMRSADSLTLRLEAPDMHQFDSRLAGGISADAVVQGTLQAPFGRLDARAKGLNLGPPDPGANRLRATAAHVSATLDATARIALRLEAQGVSYATLNWPALRAAMDLRGDAHGGIRSDVWSGTLSMLEGTGAWPLKLAAPADFSLARTAGREHFSLPAALLTLLGGRLEVAQLDWRPGVLRTRGRVSTLRVAPFFASAKIPFAPGSTLALRGTWAFDNALALLGEIMLERESGDLMLDSADKLAAGLSELRLAARSEGRTGAQRVALEARLASTRLGSIAASGHATPPGGTLDAATLKSSVLAVMVKASLPSLRGVSALAGNIADFDGRAGADLRIGGTLDAPLVTGALSVDALRITSPPVGIDLRNGRLRATLDAHTLILDSFSIAGPVGTLSATGRLPRKGVGHAPAGNGTAASAASLAWKADGLRILNRPGQRAQVTGEGTIVMSHAAGDTESAVPVVRGKLRIDEGRFNFERDGRATLSEDVRIIGAQRKDVPRGRMPRIQVDLELEIDRQFVVTGAGLDSGLAGSLRISGHTDTGLTARGRVRAVNGSYLLAGQKVDIERGELVFDGPLDNPALDILVLRKYLPVEAGAQISGTARVPSVQLVSNPPVPDSEKLAWIVLGRSLGTASGADFGLLQAAAGMVGGSNRRPLTQRISRDIGLDDISFRSTEAGQQALALGKRLSDRLYVEVEQGLTVASSILRLNFVLTRTLTARIEAGSSSGVGAGGIGFYYGRSFD